MHEPSKVESACTRRELLGLLLLLAAGPAQAGEEHLDDSRTARAVSLSAPRGPLRECLRVLSEASGVSLSAAPSLSEEPLVAYVPKRALRETMGALAELFDGVWTASGGAAGRIYRLDPEPAAEKRQAAARTAHLREILKALDDAAAQAARDAKEGRVAAARPRPGDTFALLVWGQLPPADRERVLRGATVTFPVPEARSGPLYDLSVMMAAVATPTIDRKKKQVGPLLATVDLDDRTDTGIPSLRARATAMRSGSVIGAIASMDLPLPKPVRPEPAAVGLDSPALPANIGQGGQFSGDRDEMILLLGEGAGIPILARHRSYGGTSGVIAGGRKLGEVMDQLATQTDSRVTTTARGFQLLRSRTERLDPSGYPPPGPVQAYLKQQPRMGQVVPSRLMIPLGMLTPFQLSILERSNICSAEAEFARNGYALLRFYHVLSPAQQEALFSPKGLLVSELTHAQIHMLLDERAKRGDFNLLEPLQAIPGLRLRFTETPELVEDALKLESLREEVQTSEGAATLPVTAEELRPSATR